MCTCRLIIKSVLCVFFICWSNLSQAITADEIESMIDEYDGLHDKRLEQSFDTCSAELFAYKSNEGESIFLKAIAMGKFETVKFLVTSFAICCNFKEKRNDGFNAMDIAYHTNNWDILVFFINKLDAGFSSTTKLTLGASTLRSQLHSGAKYNKIGEKFYTSSSIEGVNYEFFFEEHQGGLYQIEGKFCSGDVEKPNVTTESFEKCMRRIGEESIKRLERLAL